MGDVPISFSVPMPLGAAYIPILLCEVEHEQRSSNNGDCSGEDKRAYTIYDPIIGGESTGNILNAFRRYSSDIRLVPFISF